MLYFLVSVALIGLAVLGIIALVQWGRGNLDSNKKALVESERTLGKAERALRSIANGSGNPVLEAQIALDEITNYHEKELN